MSRNNEGKARMSSVDEWQRTLGRGKRHANARAMKMENVIKSTVSATVEEVSANAASAVEKGELLIKFAE